MARSPSPRILHLLSQRPSRTGSGVTLGALAREAARAGWDQQAVVGVPADDPAPVLQPLTAAQVRPLVFGTDGLDFALPGMSDVMPYASSRFSALSEQQLAAYRRGFKAHIAAAIEEFSPDLIHSHHVWLMSAMVKSVAPDVPVVTQCHATGLRQMTLCPHLAQEVQRGCAQNERFLALHAGHADQLVDDLQIDRERIHVVGAGYREDLFHGRGRQGRGERLLFIGKYSNAKGLPWLLDAVERLSSTMPGLSLHVAGTGAGAEADTLARRMEGMAPRVVLHGMLDQPTLADLARRCDVCVLPSMYEGVPLVLVEALACGCRLVCTELPGVLDRLAPHLGDYMDLVKLPRLTGADTPEAADLPAFVEDLAGALQTALERPSIKPAPLVAALEPFTWRAVFSRVQAVWEEIRKR